MAVFPIECVGVLWLTVLNMPLLASRLMGQLRQWRRGPGSARLRAPVLAAGVAAHRYYCRGAGSVLLDPQSSGLQTVVGVMLELCARRFRHLKSLLLPHACHLTLPRL